MKVVVLTVPSYGMTRIPPNKVQIHGATIKRSAVLWISLLMFLLMACGKTEDEHYRLGLSLVDEEPQRAVEELSKSFFPEDPSFPSDWFAQQSNQDRYSAQGRAYLNLGQFENAEADFAQLWPARLGDLRFSLAEYEAAITAYSEDITDPPFGDPLAATYSYLKRGNSYKKIGDHPNAISDLNHVLDITLKRLDLETKIRCVGSLALRYRPLGELDCGTEAEIEEYKSSRFGGSIFTAIAAYQSRAEVHVSPGNYSQAISDYESATGYDNGSHGSFMLFVWLGLGDTYRAVGANTDAIIAYTKVIEAVIRWPDDYGEDRSYLGTPHEGNPSGVYRGYRLNHSVSGLAEAWKSRGEIYIEEGHRELGEGDLWTACYYASLGSC